MTPGIVFYDPNDAADNNVRQTGFGFKKADRLLKRCDFKRLYRSSRSVANGLFVIRYRVRPQHESLTVSRLGVTVSRRVGNAVVRNRLKRMVREFYRYHRDMLPTSIDLNVIARKRASGQKNYLLRASLEALFKKIEVRENHQPTS